MIRIAITGHRPNKLWGYNLYTTDYIKLGKIIRDTVLSLSSKHSECELISGMALGVDTLFALIALKLASKTDKYSLHCAIPCINHSSKWSGSSVIQYNDILSVAGSVHLVSTEPYTPQCMQNRNTYMVDRCDVLIAVWDGTNGGTANCIKYAESVNKKIIFINPKHI